MEEGYEADGACGPFMTKEAAERHAALSEAEDHYVVYLSDIDLSGRTNGRPERAV